VLKRQGRLVAGGEGGRGYEDIVVCPEGAHVYGIPAQISRSFDNYITRSRTIKDLNYPKRLLLAKIKKIGLSTEQFIINDDRKGYISCITASFFCSNEMFYVGKF
jgi:hypothetical protein